MPTYHIIYGGRQHITADSEEDAYRQFWQWVTQQATEGNFGLIVDVDNYEAIPREDGLFMACQVNHHAECIGSSLGMRRDHQLVTCLCECHREELTDAI